jgi:hypothetical protein
VIEIRDWGGPTRRRAQSRPIMVGRACAREFLTDDGAGQHLRLVPSLTALSVVDRHVYLEPRCPNPESAASRSVRLWKEVTPRELNRHHLVAS